MLCEALVDEGVIRIQQIDHAAVLADDAVEEHLRFAPERLPKIVVEIVGFWPGVLQFAQVKPLPGESFSKGGRSRIRQHSARLVRKHPGIVQFVLLRQLQQFIVGNAAPQEEGQPRSQFQIADGVDAARRCTGWLLLETEDEPRVDQNARQRRFDSVLEAAGVLALLVKAEQVSRDRRHLPGAGKLACASDVKIRFGACGFVVGTRMANENLPAARRISRSGGIRRSCDRDACNRRIIGIHGLNVVHASRAHPRAWPRRWYAAPL